MKENVEVDGEKTQSQRTAVFEVKTNDLNYVQSLGIYHKDLQENCLKNISIDEYAAHFWQNSLPSGAMLVRVEYMGVLVAARAHPRFKNVISSVQRISVDEVAHEEDLTENWQMQIRRP